MSRMKRSLRPGRPESGGGSKDMIYLAGTILLYSLLRKGLPALFRITFAILGIMIIIAVLTVDNQN